MAKIKNPKNNKKTKNKIIAVTVLGTVVLGTGATVVGLKHEDIKSWFNGQKTYSYAEVEQMLDQNNKSWEAKLKNLLTNSDELKSQLSDITKAKLQSDQRLAELTNELELAREQHSAEVESLESELNQEQAINAELTTQANALTELVATLEAQIQLYKDIIAQYETDNTASVTFYDDDGALITSGIVNKGTTFTLNEELLPTSSEHKIFKGFAVNGVIVDHTTYVVNGPTTFTAVYDIVYTLTFNHNETTSTVKVVNGELESALPVVETETDFGRSGWIDQNGNYVTDANLVNTTSNLTLTPNIVQQKRIKIKYRTSSSGSYTEYTSYCYAGISTDATGKVSGYVLVQSDEFNALVDKIEALTGKTASGKCFSLVESQSGYLSSIGPMQLGTDTTDYYVYLTLS